jgi:hypothetical protein
MNGNINRKLTVGCAIAALIVISAVLPAGAFSVVLDALPLEDSGVDIFLIFVPRADGPGRPSVEEAGWFSSDMDCSSVALTGDGEMGLQRIILTDRYLILVTSAGRCIAVSGMGSAEKGTCENSCTDASSNFTTVRRLIGRHLKRFSALASCCLEAVFTVARSLSNDYLSALFS